MTTFKSEDLMGISERVFGTRESTLEEEAAAASVPDLKQSVRAIRRMLASAAGALPESAYAAQPDDQDGNDVWSAGEIVSHIAGTMIWTDANLHAVNVTFEDNDVTIGSGGALSGGRAYFSTFVDNSTGTLFVESGGGHSISYAVIGASIVVGGSSPLCGSSGSADFNIGFDASCGSKPGDQPNTNPVIGDFEVSAGSTATRVPLVGSPAIDAVPSGTAQLCDGTLPIDQRLSGRPSGAACDIGAVERQPGDG